MKKVGISACPCPTSIQPLHIGRELCNFMSSPGTDSRGVQVYDAPNDEVLEFRSLADKLSPCAPQWVSES